MSQIALDAALALQWFLEDETDRGYSLAVLQRLYEEDSALVPMLWFYEVGNGLVMACRRKRITFEKAREYLAKLRRMPIQPDDIDPTVILTLPHLAEKHGLTNYDAAYLELAIRRNIALATTDQALRRAATGAGVPLVAVM